MIVCDGISPEDIKRIINSEILKKIIRDQAKEVYDEEKKKEQEEIIGNAKGKGRNNMKSLQEKFKNLLVDLKKKEWLKDRKVKVVLYFSPLET